MLVAVDELARPRGHSFESEGKGAGSAMPWRYPAGRGLLARGRGGLGGENWSTAQDVKCGAFGSPWLCASARDAGVACLVFCEVSGGPGCWVRESVVVGVVLVLPGGGRFRAAEWQWFPGTAAGRGAGSGMLWRLPAGRGLGASNPRDRVAVPGELGLPRGNLGVRWQDPCGCVPWLAGGG